MSQPQRPLSILSGAAFLMAVSAIGPGFLTQTTQFTVKLGANLAFAILISTLIDIGAQLNTWRIICVSKKYGHQVASAVVPGLGGLVLAVILFGSFVFNIGNLGGCALALEAMFGVHKIAGATLSAAIAVGLFLLPAMLKGVDQFSKALGAGMILITLYVVFQTAPDVGLAARRAVLPETIDSAVIVTLVGGTIGGYIMFSGAHRLLDGGVSGPEQVQLISWAAIQGIVIAGVMRTLMFLAVLGVVQAGAQLGSITPVFDAFYSGAGDLGFVLSCIVFWAAAVTSVVGCSYTSISFVRPDADDPSRPRLIVLYTLGSLAATIVLMLLDVEATPLLIAAGQVNGVLLPIIFGAILIAGQNRQVMGDHRNPLWATLLGVLAWLGTVYLAVRTASLWL